MIHSVDEPQESEPVKPINYRLILLAVLVGIFVVLIGIILAFFIQRSFNQMFEDKLVAQPFNQNNDFLSFRLSNDLQVLIMKPNFGMKTTYICDINSVIGWSWF